MDDAAALSRRLSADSIIMFVDHRPFMERLTSYLVAGSQDLTVFKFQNAGIVCLDQDTGVWSIKWALLPEIN